MYNNTKKNNDDNNNGRMQSMQSKYNTYFSFLLFVNLCIIHKLFPKIVLVQTAPVCIHQLEIKSSVITHLTGVPGVTTSTYNRGHVQVSVQVLAVIAVLNGYRCVLEEV